MNNHASKLVGIVGPCAAGKTTLASGLHQHGFAVRQIAQEHSYVQQMWERLVNPDVLIYLDVSYPVSLKRRPQNFTPGDFADQLNRLRHARQNADLYIDTDPLSIQEVLDQVVHYLSVEK